MRSLHRLPLKDQLKLENIKFSVECISSISFITEVIKVLWHGWHSIWAFVLGLDWIVGMMVSATVLVSLTAAVSLWLLPLVLYFGGMRLFPLLSDRLWTNPPFSEHIPKVVRDVLGIVALLCVAGIFLSLANATAELVQKHYSKMVFGIGAVGGAVIAFWVKPTDLVEPWVTIVRVVGWLAVLCIPIMAILIFASPRQRPPSKAAQST